MAGGRRTNEEGRVPVAGERAHFKERCSIGERHQDNEGSRSSDGHGRMHDDTQRAMIRVAGSRMHVRHLDSREKGQQRQAHQHHPRKSNWIAAAAT